MFPLANTSKLLSTITTSTLTLANIIMQFPIAVAYRAGLHHG
jgi:hypothetical protein